MDNLTEFIKNNQGVSDTVIVFSYQGKLFNPRNLKIIGSESFSFFRGDISLIQEFILLNDLSNFELFCLSSKQKVKLLDYDYSYRVEPGAIIRDKVKIGKDAVILMNATINVGVEIGERTMIDMGAVIGSKAKIGKDVHIASNVVIAGVLEPVSKKEVIIEDNVFIGANSVVLEGVKIGHHSVIGAMCLVNKDIPPYSKVIGVPCKIVGTINEEFDKCQNNVDLR